MDVTKENFIQLLPEISDTIRNCDFIAFDTEFSGLHREKCNFFFDTPEERFAKAVETGRDFFVMQFGLACFTRTSSLKYDNKTWNFYIFPQPVTNELYNASADRIFAVQAESMQFLSQHGFDFNKLFKHGLSYLTWKEKSAITDKLKLGHKAQAKVERGNDGLPSFVPQPMRTDCKGWLAKILEFVALRNNFTYKPGLEENKFRLIGCCTNHKRSIFKRILESSAISENIVIDEELDHAKDKYLVIEYVSKEMKREKERNEFMLAKGFLEILELIITNKKPIVGHNLLLDLIRIIDQFIEPLTNDYTTFKMLCNSWFPYIYDTKYIATLILDPATLGSNQTRLQDLHYQLSDSCELPKIQVNYANKPDDKEVPHQAGYDAYMSGYSFIVLCESYLGTKPKALSADILQEPIAKHSKIVEDFSNKIHMMYSYDYTHFNTGGDDEQPNRDHVFYVEHPDTWKLEDFFQAFSAYGGVKVGHLNRTSALCALRDPRQQAAVLSKAKKMKMEGSNFTIHSYESYLENFKRRALLK